MRTAVSKAEGQLTSLVRRTKAGDEVILTRHGRAAKAPFCRGVLAVETPVLISAGTMAEALTVAAGRHVADELMQLVNGLDREVIPVTAASARRIAQAYARSGKGTHPAGLNLGDCFAYEVAQEHSCPLLFVSEGVSRTDVDCAL